MDDIAIDISGVSKDFVLPHEKVDSIKSVFVNPLKAKKESKSTETQHALKNINFKVKKGEFFGIVGRNGSGKSTLLKIIAHIYQPTKGIVDVYGKLVPFIELGVGFNPELTGRENVYLNGALLGFSESDVDQKYKKIVEFAELDRFMDQKLKNYSSGMQVRLAFSVATILADSDILLIDEVLAVGDADFQRKCFNYFKKLKREKKTIVFVSHDMSAVREYCDRAAFINESKLVAVDSADKIAKMYDKLFISEIAEDVREERIDEKRWGTEEIVTKSIKVKVDKENITITQAVKFNIDAESPIVGMRIRSASGDAILGTNTKLEDFKIGKNKAGSELNLEWKFKNVLAQGTYFIDPAVILADGITTTDWWDEAAAIDIKRRALPYDIDLDYEIKVL